MVCPNTTLAAAVRLAERIVRDVRADRYGEADNLFPVTMSIGVANRSSVDADVEALVARADKALYAAKSGGRNRVQASRGEAG